MIPGCLGEPWGSVVFAPTNPGIQGGSIVIETEDHVNNTGGVLAVDFYGNGTRAPAPSLNLSPASLTFNNQVVGTTSAAQSVTLTNTGNAPLALDSISLGGANPGSFSISAGGAAGMLAPGASQSISVVFHPTAAGPQSASLIISDNATGSPQQISLSGTGTISAPAVTLSPTSLTFAPEYPTYYTSSPQSATLTNSGNAPLVINSLSVTGANASDFAITGGGTAGSLAPGASQRITLTFTPTGVGSRAAALTVASNAPGSPHTVALNGTGLQPSFQGQLSGTDQDPFRAVLNFGSQLLGTTSAPRSFTLTNVGTAAGTFQSASFNGGNGFRIVADTSESRLLPGAGRTVTITFTPNALGFTQGNITFYVRDEVNNNVGTYSLDLQGSGVAPAAPAVTLNPAGLGFGSQAVGTTSAPQSVTLTNSGNGPLTINSISLGGANPGSFAMIAGGGSGTLAPGSGQTISLTFTPPAVGGQSATLTLVSNAPGSPHSVGLTGSGEGYTRAVGRR
jgi:trimeric autotransporter adhesin